MARTKDVWTASLGDVGTAPAGIGGDPDGGWQHLVTVRLFLHRDPGRVIVARMTADDADDLSESLACTADEARQQARRR